jgi:DNA-binding LytR/AlgR family response regulator
MKLEIVVDANIDELEVTLRTPRADDPTCVSALRFFEKPQTLMAKKRGSLHNVAIDEALWFESVDDKVFLYTAKETFETTYRLYELEEWLSVHGFYRIGKSQIVCLSKIRSFKYALSGRLEATLINNEKVIISRSYVKFVKAKLEEMGGIRHEST